MKTYQSCIKGIAGLVMLLAITSGCSREENEGHTEVPLSISAAFPYLLSDRATRAENSLQVKVALNATASAYAAEAKTYNVVSSSSSITLTPDGAANTLSISGSAQTTPLTIYGWLDENTPVYYSNTGATVSQGEISNIELTPAFACIGVRIESNSTEPAGCYTITSSRLKGTGTYTSDASWNTSGQIPVLNSNSSCPSIKNTEITTLEGFTADKIKSEYFMRVIPDNITSTSENLFSVTLPGRQALQIPGKPINIKAGNCYLFTIDIGRETAVEISSIKEIPVSDVVEIVVYNKGQKGIYTLQDLKYFRDMFNYGVIWENEQQIHKSLDQWVDNNNVVTLRADIDLKNEPWIPIGVYGEGYDNDERAFKLTFDGNGHTIYNLNIQNNEGDLNGLYSSGFFSLVTGTVKGLTIDGAVISDGDRLMNAGVIAGSLWDGFIYDCHVKGTVQVSINESFYDQTNVGGIVGEAITNEAEHAAIAACTVQTDASSKFTGKYIGGILGNINNGQVDIVGCIAHDIIFNEEEDASTVKKFAAITSANSGFCYNCVAYNCVAYYQNQGYGIGADYQNSYFFNVAGITEDEGGTRVNSMEELNGFDIVKALYDNAAEWQISDEKKMSHHYHASPPPYSTGPYLLPGQRHMDNENKCGFNDYN